MRGLVSITVKDQEGRPVKQVKKENIITEAVSRLLNAPNMCERYFDPTSHYGMIIPLYSMLFSGISLWSETLPEDVLCPPNPLAQVGHAGGAYAGWSTQRGSLNALESGAVEGGYKYVWDFDSNQGNGTIKTLAAVPRRGGDIGWNKDAEQEGAWLTRLSQTPYTQDDSPASDYGLGFYNGSYYLASISGSTVTVTRYEPKENPEITLMQMAFPGVLQLAESFDVSLSQSSLANKYYWHITPQGELIIPKYISTSSMYFGVINLDTKAIDRQLTISPPQGQSFYSSPNWIFIGRKALVAVASGWKTGAIMVDFDTGVAEYAPDIPMYGELGESGAMQCYFPGGAVHYGYNGRGYIYTLTGATPVPSPPAATIGNYYLMKGFTGGGMYPLVWGNNYYYATSGSSRRTYDNPSLWISWLVFTSICNLPAPVVKSPGQTMKIEYTFLEGEG